MDVVTIEQMAHLVKDSIDTNDPVEYWNKLSDFLTKEPAVFFSAVEPRYVGKRRLEKLYVALSYEIKQKAKNSIEVLLFEHLSRYLKGQYKKPVLFSVGYEAMNIEGFILKLQRNGIKTIVDVREKPISRKKGFAKSALSQALRSAGIDYVHVREMGSPENARKDLHSNKNWQKFEEKYLEYLAGQRESLVELSMKIKAGAFCLMCFERNYNECHRSILAKEIQRFSDVEVIHL